MRLVLPFTILALLAVPCSQAAWPLGAAMQCATNCDCPEAAPRCWHRVLAGLSQCVELPQPQEEPFLYLHIPKTGGSTFRRMAEAVFGFDRMCFDLGKDDKVTSEIVKTYYYSRLWRGTWPEVARRNCSFIAGHKRSTIHINTFGLRHTMSTVRNPEDRLVSQYYMELLRIIKYNTGEKQETFEEFVAHKFNDMYEAGVAQWQMLRVREIPPQALGFIAITERYTESIDVFNAAYNQNFTFTEIKNKNEMREADGGSRATITEGMREKLASEWRLYRLVNNIFDERKRMQDACKPYVHGAIYNVTETEVTGFAWWAHSDDPVQVRALIDDKPVGEEFAVDRHELRKWTVPRHGFVGFRFELSERLRAKQEVRIEVVETGQLLGSSTLDGKGKLLWRDIVPDEEFHLANAIRFHEDDDDF